MSFGREWCFKELPRNHYWGWITSGLCWANLDTILHNLTKSCCPLWSVARYGSSLIGTFLKYFEYILSFLNVGQNWMLPFWFSQNLSTALPLRFWQNWGASLEITHPTRSSNEFWVVNKWVNVHLGFTAYPSSPLSFFMHIHYLQSGSHWSTLLGDYLLIKVYIRKDSSIVWVAWPFPICSSTIRRTSS